jgi:hypothetical protein
MRADAAHEKHSNAVMHHLPYLVAELPCKRLHFVCVGLHSTTAQQSRARLGNAYCVTQCWAAHLH